MRLIMTAFHLFMSVWGNCYSVINVIFNTCLFFSVKNHIKVIFRFIMNVFTFKFADKIYVLQYRNASLASKHLQVWDIMQVWLTGEPAGEPCKARHVSDSYCSLQVKIKCWLAINRLSNHLVHNQPTYAQTGGTSGRPKYRQCAE